MGGSLRDLELRPESGAEEKGVRGEEERRERNWSGEVNCKLCSLPETTDHILFQCPVANFLWTFLRDALG